MKLHVACLGGFAAPGLTPKALNGLTLLTKNLRHVITDFDDTLVEGGIGTKHSRVTQESFLAANRSKIRKFKSICRQLTSHNIKFAICTGRSGSFVIPWMEHLFSPDICDVIIGEGGATIHRFVDGEWKLETPKCVDRESNRIFMANREKIIEIITTDLRGFHETGKLVIASFNPPALPGGGVMPIEHFFVLCKAELEKLGLLGKISLNHSATAVDIGPLGADKVDAMLEVTGGGHHTAYAGDAMNDRSAMFQCLINLVPANANAEFKKEASQAMCCLFSRLEVLDGVSDLFRTILNLLEKKY